VEFLPLEKSAIVPYGTTILNAAIKAGVDIDAPCGGQGRCGKCLVRIEKGRVSQGESLYLSKEQIQQGWVLSCVAGVASDLVISVPSKQEQARIASRIATTKEAAMPHLDWPLLSPVSQFYVELPPPDLTDNAADFDRLKAAVAAKYEVKDFSISLASLRKLSQNLRKANWQVTLTIDTRSQERGPRLINVHLGRKKQPLLGVAVDVGTTNVAASLVDLTSGRIIDQVSSLNKQRACGEDVISRIIYSEHKGGVRHLNRLIMQTINELLDKFTLPRASMDEDGHLKAADISYMVVAGNTAMIQLFLSLPPTHIRQEPYIPTATHFPLVNAKEVGIKINPEASIYCFPAVAAYIGGDITAGVLSSHLFQSDKLSLFLDIGTNGEIVLGDSDWMVTCACSAGPAFEGAGVSCGMPANTGAIEDVTINSRTLDPTFKVIGDVPPLGICGSGMISALAEMLNTGVIDRSGNIKREILPSPRIRSGEHGTEYVLCWAADSAHNKDIVLNEADIDNLIRTKAAIYAGIMVMLKKVGISAAEIEQVLIGGAFGQHINVERAIQIGLLPDLPWEKFYFLGNTSLAGAYNVLLSRQAQQEAEKITQKITYLELIADNTFMSELTAASFLPHTNPDYFPSARSKPQA
jgi:uncharacterized 2Fe-2S/4Fe-4S cluster protein (DUF4445 family)